MRTNAGAGSITATYDPCTLDLEEIERELEALCLAPETTPRGISSNFSKRLNRATKIGMMTTLGTSLAFGYLGNKKAHIGFGTAFVAFAGMHILRYQRTLIR